MLFCMTASPWQYFTTEELTCRCGCGQMRMDAKFMPRLVQLRRLSGIELQVTSGYRCPQHNARVSGTGDSGPHTTGRAVDVRVRGKEALRIIDLAISLGFTGIGVMQRGPHDARYLHLDDLPAAPGQPRPWLWSY